MTINKELAEKFKYLKENYSPVRVIEYAEYIRSLPIETVLENAEVVFVEPLKGADLFYEILKENKENIPISLLESVYNFKLLPYVAYALKGGYENKEHIDKLEKCMQLMREIHEAFEFKKDTIRILQEKMSRFNLPNEKALLEGIMEMQPDLATDYDDYEDEEYDESDFELLKKKLECKFAIDFVETFMDENEDINMESFNSMLRTAYLYDLVCAKNEEYVHEGVISKTARKVAVKGDELARKTVHGIRKAGSQTKRVKVVAKRIPQHFDNLVNSTLGQIAKMDKNERRKRIIEGGYKLKLFKLIRNGILIGAAWAVSPALAAIGILASILLDGRLDDKVRTEIIEELHSELRIVREKIKDADRKGDDKKKYQLMRIEDKLEKDLHRIQMRADKIIVSHRGVRI
jgi:hypothetical protein